MERRGDMAEEEKEIKQEKIKVIVTGHLRVTPKEPERVEVEEK